MFSGKYSHTPWDPWGSLRTFLPKPHMAKKKQTTAKHTATDIEVSGYEIHHGRTVSRGMRPWIETRDGEIIGVSHPQLSVCGTYLHGLFDSDQFRRVFIDSIRIKRGFEPIGKVVYTHDIEASIDRLAVTVRGHLDLDAIYEIMGI